MRLKFWMSCILLAGVLFVSGGSGQGQWKRKLKDCAFKKNVDVTFHNVLLPDNFTYFKRGSPQSCMVFVKEGLSESVNKFRPQMEGNMLYLSRWLRNKMSSEWTVLNGACCCHKLREIIGRRVPTRFEDICHCTVKNFPKGQKCALSVYSEKDCANLPQHLDDMFLIDITSANCVNCDKPAKKPAKKVPLKTSDQPAVNAAEASQIMTNMTQVAASLDETTASLSGGENMEGVIVTDVVEEEDAEEVSFCYQSPNESFSIINNSTYLSRYSRTVTVSKEALEKAARAKISSPFVAVLRFRHLARDEKNSTVLGDEVLAVEMGTEIKNLTEKIKIDFKNMTYSGTPTCHSWDGQGSRPNWTSEGSMTLADENHISCQFSHLTFFAILLTPPNETISSSDLNNLTIITQVGCGVSIFFLSLILFMHCLVSRTEPTDAIKILIHLVVALFLLNLTFLINPYVARLQSAWGCRVMALLTHSSMLATFSWFAAQAFHLYLQMSNGFNIRVQRYVLKVAVVSWGIPCVFGISLLSAGKYGEQVVRADNPDDNVAMCWVTDATVHYAVNIGYYAVVFLFTLSCFVSIVTWLCCAQRANSVKPQGRRNGVSIFAIMSLCCMLGITWGFAFFAYGAMRIPSYYIFTILNSFQGFFLFIYFFKNRQPWIPDTSAGGDTSTSTTTSTTTSGSDAHIQNPYAPPEKKQC